MRKWTSPRLSVSFVGDAEAGRALVGQARIYTGYLIDQMKGQPFRAQTWTRMDGSTISVKAFGGLLGHRASVVITVPEGGPEAAVDFPFLALTWFPRGLCVTPTSETARYGYGFPKRHGVTGICINPPFGTLIEREEDSALNQVLFNRFENNGYLDRPEFIAGVDLPGFRWPDNPRLRDSLEVRLRRPMLAPYVAWTFGFTPVLLPDFDRTFWEASSEHNIKSVDEPGYNKFVADGLIRRPSVPYRIRVEDSLRYPDLRQLDGVVHQIYEEETDRWFAHWPEELLYENFAFEAIFQGTNLLRAAAGEKPVTRAIRGFANGADRTSVEMALAGRMLHNAPEIYRSGYEMLNGRIAAMRNNGRVVGENIAVHERSRLEDQATGEALVEAWRNSPPHYANMIDSGWSQPAGGTALDVGGGYPVKAESPLPSGYGYAQWFVQRKKWLHGGLFMNETPYGPVSVRALRCYLYMGFYTEDYDAFSVYFAGREFVIRQVLDSLLYRDPDPELQTVQVVIGATAFSRNGQLWLRAIAVAIGHEPGFYSYISPIANADEEYRWLLEASLLVPADPPSTSYPTSGFSFTPDGRKGIGSVSLLSDEVATPMFPDDIEPYRAYFVPYDVVLTATDDAATLQLLTRPPLPRITFSYETEPDTEEATMISWFEQKVEGIAKLHSFYVGDELTSLDYRVDMRCYQHRANNAAFHCNDTLIFPSGKEVPVVRQTLAHGVPVGPCYFVSFLYIDPRTENIVYAKVDLRRDANEIYGTLSFFYNDTLLKTYPERLIADHYPMEDLHISATWGNETGPSIPQHILNLYDIGFLRNMDTDGRLFPLPYMGAINQYWGPCPDAPAYVRYHPNAPCAGTYPVSAGTRDGCNFSCRTRMSGERPTIFWSYEIGVPGASQSSLDLEGADTVRCEFAEYNGRVAIDILFYKICKITSDNPDGDHIIYTNFDAEQEIGIGPLTSLMPLGVV